MTDFKELEDEKKGHGEENREAKILRFSKHLCKKQPKEEIEITPEQESYETRIDSLEALFMPASLLVDDISYLVLEIGSEKEKEAWQKFVSRFNLALCAFQDFWETGIED